MSGHHPPSWNHHPMQVPPYIPRLAHMSNERPIGGGGPWHNSGAPGGNHPHSGAPTGPDHNQYPYIPANNRKHAMDMNPMLPPQYNRHADYDSPMMDLSVSSAMRNNNQFSSSSNTSSTSPRSLGGYHHNNEQDYSSNRRNYAADSNKDTCDGLNMMMLPPANGTMQNNEEISSRRQNPVGLPPMSEPMELVKEALLKTIKSQVPALSDLPFINDGNNALAELVALHQKQTDGINLSCDASMAAAPDVKQQHQQQPLVNDESENAIGLVKEQSRRKTRKPNKTSKVVNEEDEMVLPVVATGRVSTDVEEEDAGAGDVESNNKSGQGEIESMEKEKRNSNSSPAGGAVAVKRHGTNESPTVDENGTPTTTKKKKRNRRSNDSTADLPGQTTPTTTTPVKGESTTPVKESNGERSHNGNTVVVEEKPDKPPAVDPVESSFEDVENKLTEMFAGIADVTEEAAAVKQTETIEKTQKEEEKEEKVTTKKKTTPNRRKSVCLSMLVSDKDLDSDDEDFCLETEKASKKKKTKAPQKKNANKTANGGAANGNGEGKAAGGGGGGRKRGGKSGGKASKKKAIKWDEEVVPVKKAAPKETDEGRYRGPLLQVRQDGSLGVLNGPQGQTEDDQDARSGVKGKKFLNGAERNKVMRGLHTNTLSMKYDTDRTDTTWVCVFCKLGPHKMGLGDLFGPYMATTDCDEFRQMQAHAGDLFKSNRSKKDMVQTAPNRLPVVPAGGGVLAAAAAAVALKSPNSKMTSPAKRGPKKKQKAAADGSVIPPAEGNPVDADLYLGLTKATENSFEIWLHEDCIVWGSGIHMIAGRLVGVDEAVWGSTSSRCGLCRKAGAVVCCLQRGCSERAHVPCGRQSNWLLDEELLHSYCQQHRSRGGGDVGVKTDPLPVASTSR